MKRARIDRFAKAPWRATHARRLGALALSLLSLVALGGCGGSAIPVPKTGAHVSEEPILVPYPPPPARVEIIPRPPGGSQKMVWIDGEWQWKGRRWVWQAGQWEMPYPGGYYAPPATVRLSDGSLVYYPGTWKEGKKQL